MQKVLAILGAGPKAMAIAAKAIALKKSGYSVPQIIIIEKYDFGANWSGNHGHTDGKHSLGTPPSKDIGFPYFTNYDSKVNKTMIGYFSWQAFLSGENINWMNYSGWVDRGMPHPPHRIWREYLNWVKKQVETDDSIKFIIGEVVKVNSTSNIWNITYRDVNSNEIVLNANGIVFTGPGDLVEIENQPVHPRVLTCKSFWLEKTLFSEVNTDSLNEPICIIGAGESSASILSEIASRLDSSNPPNIHLINEQGIIFSRGENYFENSIYTDADSLNWSQLSIEQRNKVISRTDRGVFSIDALKSINQMTNLTIIKGRADKIVIDEPEGTPRIIIVDKQLQQTVEIPASYVIVSIGYNPWAFLNLLNEELKVTLEANKESVVNTIQYDLTVNWDTLEQTSKSLLPKLHLPMLSGLAQGPGFPNLSCLGTLADRILQSYVEK